MNTEEKPLGLLPLVYHIALGAITISVLLLIVPFIFRQIAKSITAFKGIPVALGNSGDTGGVNAG